MLNLIGIPAMGALMGGIYSFPAEYITKRREPWLTLMLACGLACTVFGLGFLFHLPQQWTMHVWLASVGALLLVRIFFGVKNNIEYFGIVHVVTLLVMLAAII